jgi:hypothetical protein
MVLIDVSFYYAMRKDRIFPNRKTGHKFEDKLVKLKLKIVKPMVQYLLILHAII